MLEDIIRHLKREKRGVSNVIVVMLSLILVVIIVANVILWSYQMSQFDWERTQERIEITDVRFPSFILRNGGSLTVHVVSLWIINATHHVHYDVDFFINSGENSTYVRPDIGLPTGDFMVKTVTERGNMAVLVKP